MINPGDIDWDSDEEREGSSRMARSSPPNYGQPVSRLTHNRSIGLSFLGLRSAVTLSGASPQPYHPVVLDPISCHSGPNVRLYYYILIYSHNLLFIRCDS
jgi:hypothetical protein